MPPSESLFAVPAGIIAQRRGEGKVEVAMPPVEHAEIRDAVAISTARLDMHLGAGPRTWALLLYIALAGGMFSAMARGFGWL